MNGAHEGLAETEMFNESEYASSVPARFEKMVARFSERVALVDEQHAITYGMLNIIVNRMAHAILHSLGEGEEPVGIFLGQNVWSVAAVYAILKAGKGYVPMNPADDPVVSQRIMDDCGARLLLTDTPNAGEVVAQQQLLVDQLSEDWPDHNPNLSIPASSLAYILYTSGTTSSPKGVFADHRALLHHTWAFSALIGVTPEDRFSLARPIRASGSIKDIFGSLLNGSSVIVFDFPRIGLTQLAEGFRKQKVTIASMLISVFRELIRTLDSDGSLPDLRIAVAGGDTIRPDDIDQFLRVAAPNARFCSSYAATEMGNTAAAHLYSKETPLGAKVTAGLPLPHRELSIIDNENRSLGPYQVGRICARSPYLACGYWRNPDLTAASFVREGQASDIRTYRSEDLGYLDERGYLFLLGRADNQVRVGGDFVDFSQVEHALLTIKGVEDALVSAWENSQGTRQIAAYVISRAGINLTEEELRHQLALKGVRIRIPAQFIFLPQFPRTSSGKVDRQQLPRPESKRPQLLVPHTVARTPLEQIVCSLWQEVVGLDEIGIHDPFLDLGGNSLQAMGIVARLQAAFGVEIPLADLFAAGTVAEMALVVTSILSDALSAGRHSDVEPYNLDVHDPVFGMA